jgi:hypothetical protein
MLRYTEKRTTNGLEVRFFRLFEGLRLVKKWVRFELNGVSFVTRILGVSIGSTRFDRSKIYGFRYAVDGHGHAQMLQFNYAGEGQIVLANNVREGEVSAFLEHLRQEGFEYSKSWDRPQSGSGILFN